MKYVVTAISRLTGEREAISNPKELETAVRLCMRLKAVKPCKRVWLRPSVKPYPWQEGTLRF